MLRIQSITLRNWATVREDTITFPEYGLILVNGQNLTGHGKLKSVGSGKTALGEALSRALLGVPGRYAKIGHYSYKDEGNTYVAVNATLNGSKLLVENGYKCAEVGSTGEGLRYTIGDNAPIERNRTTVTREDLSNAIGLPPKLAEWTVYVDGDSLKFNRLSQADTVHIVMSALNQPSWDVLHGKVKKASSAFKSDLISEQRAQEEARSNVEEAKEALEEAKEDLKEAEESYADELKKRKPEIKKAEGDIAALAESVKGFREDMKRIKKSIADAEVKVAEKHEALRKELLEVKSKAKQARHDRDKWVSVRADRKADLSASKKALKDASGEPDVCPTCGKDWDKKHSEDEIKRLKAAKKKAEESWNEAEDACLAWDSTLDELDDKMDGVEAKLEDNGSNEVRKLSLKYESAETSATRSENEITALETKIKSLSEEVTDAEVVQAKVIVKERRKALRSCEDRLKKAAEMLAEAEQVSLIGDYWSKAFSPAGIPNMILRDAVRPMTAISTRISERLTGGTLAINYSTSKELKSGESRAELIVDARNRYGSVRVEGNSKGESGLTNLIVSETLAELGNVPSKVGYRWYDEVINSQDGVVRHNILTYLKEVAHKRRILIFLVDHHEETEKYADYVLTATKETKGTTFKWS